MVRRTLLILAVTTLSVSSAASDLSQILLLSQRHHDPRDVWFKSVIRLTIEEARTDGTSRTSLVVLDNPGSAFELKTRRDNRQIVMSVFREKTSASLDGRLDFSKEEAAKYGLTPEGVVRRRNYYAYLYGLPMKLSDPGTITGIPVPIAKYEGRTYRKIRVSYDPKVGGDVWDFFFDAKTNALSGYRFFHDEAKGDGEFITLEGDIACGFGVRLPKSRSWFLHQDRKALGKDTITACSMETP
jgi:Family of unknown function (DUF6503)